MEESRLKQVFLSSLKRYSKHMLFYVLILLVNGWIFWLYGLELEPFFYSSIFVGFLGLVLFVVLTIREWKRSEQRRKLLHSVNTEWMNLWEPRDLEEEEYHQIIKTLGNNMNRLLTDMTTGREEMLDYYTTWVHQIKTPISVMHMLLTGEDTQKNRMLMAELFRIEQYVEMVLQYIRLGSESNDLMIQEYDLDDLLRQCIRKYAPQFVNRKLSMHYEPCEVMVKTDQKWFCSIVEQLLSNAVKYTPSGGITIAMTEDGRLKISDTGIGIAPEDVPRIFEKGFTGTNGRGGMKSSGLGLYLCKKAADLISVEISVESTPGEGTTFYLKQKQWEAAK